MLSPRNPLFSQPKHPIGVIPDDVYITHVRSAFKIHLGMSVVAGLSLSALAVAPDASTSQYRNIPDRNVFGLRPPPVGPAATNPPAALPKITLTGITTILGNKRALMKVAPNGMKPGDPKEQSLILTEGQREGEIEVLQIDENRGSVKVNNSGTEMLLTFEKDGAKLPTTPPPGPGLPPLPTALPLPGIRPNSPAAATSSALPAPPNRRTRTPRTAGTTAAPPVGGVPTPTGFTAAPVQSTVPEQDLTPEELAIVTELQRQANASMPTFTPPAATTPQTGQAAEPMTPSSTVTPGVSNPPVLLPQ